MLADAASGERLLVNVKIGRLQRQIFVEFESDRCANALIHRARQVPSDAHDTDNDEVFGFGERFDDLGFIPELPVVTRRR